MSVFRLPLKSVLLASMLCLAAGLAPGKDQSLVVWHEKTKDGYRFFARTADGFPKSLQVNLSSLKNLRSSAPNPFQTVIIGGEGGVPLFDLKVTNRFGRNQFDYDYRFVSGDFKTARHEDSHLYLLPFAHGTKHLLTQGYHGTFSHSDPGREYAIDFTMPEGTPVLAARSGTVITVRIDSNRGGAARSFENDGNHISILHADGSLAEYVHLLQDGSFVRPGQKVAAGERIGLSGNTGRSTGPHLHFHVGVPTAEGKLKTIPTQFRNHRNQAVSPEAGKSYYAFHPGKPAFTVAPTRPAVNTSYESHRDRIPRENRISTRAETIDGAIVLFLRNGYPEEKEVLLSLPTMENLTPSRQVPLALTVEAQTERFAVILKQRDLTTPFRYQTEWKYRGRR